MQLGVCGSVGSARLIPMQLLDIMCTTMCTMHTVKQRVQCCDGIYMAPVVSYKTKCMA